MVLPERVVPAYRPPVFDGEDARAVQSSARRCARGKDVTYAIKLDDGMLEAPRYSQFVIGLLQCFHYPICGEK